MLRFCVCCVVCRLLLYSFSSVVVVGYCLCCARVWYMLLCAACLSVLFIAVDGFAAVRCWLSVVCCDAAVCCGVLLFVCVECLACCCSLLVAACRLLSLLGD